jgi:hypothetical protein
LSIWSLGRISRRVRRSSRHIWTVQISTFRGWRDRRSCIGGFGGDVSVQDVSVKRSYPSGRLGEVVSIVFDLI